MDFAESCGYLDSDQKNPLKSESEEVGKLLNHMLHYPEKYLKTGDKQLIVE